MQQTYRSIRLLLTPLNLDDAEFILELLNTEGWINFIGDRKIKNREDAEKYIQKINGSPNINYWVVKSGNEKTTIGLITFIKRDYLDHYDLGFAFLPNFSNKGYAFEAAEIVLTDRLQDPNHKTILATTMENNISSIKLLEKLGFHFIKEIEHENEKLLLYTLTAPATL